MTTGIAYKNCLIWGESFQREENGQWIPQYKFTRQDLDGETKGFPTQQYQFERAFATEEEADNFALQSAKDLLDKY